MALDPVKYQQLYNDPEFAKAFPTDQDRAKAVAAMDPEFAAFPPQHQIALAQQMFSGPRFSSQQHLQSMQAGMDIPANSPLPQNTPIGQDSFTPGFGKSLANALGIPTSMPEAGQHLTNSVANMMLPPGMVQMGSAMLTAKSPSEAIGNMNPVEQMAKQPVEQIGERNWSGFAGTLTGDVLPYALGGALSRAIPNTVRPQGRPIYGDQPTVLARAAKLLPFPEWMPKIIQDYMANGKKTIGYNNSLPYDQPPTPVPATQSPVPTAPETLAATDPAQLPVIPGGAQQRAMPSAPRPLPTKPAIPPPEGAPTQAPTPKNARPAVPTPKAPPPSIRVPDHTINTGTDFPLDQATAGGPIPERLPTPPVNAQLPPPPEPISAPVKEAYTGGAKSLPGQLKRPPKLTSEGKAPLAKSPRSKTGLEQSGELPTEFHERFITPDKAKASTVLSMDDRGNYTQIQHVTADGKLATVVRGNAVSNQVLSSEVVPVRDIPKESVRAQWDAYEAAQKASAKAPKGED